MIKTKTGFAAQCTSCGKRYRIGKLNQEPACTVCRGTVRALESEEVVEEAHEPTRGTSIAGMSTCTECSAVNPAGLHYCAECGATLDVDEDAAPTAAGQRMRHEAATALKSAYRWIGAVTVGYRCGGAAYAIAALFAVIALADPEIPPRAGLLVVGLTALLSALLFMGAIHILFRPFLWTLGIALWATAVSIVHSVGPDPLGIASWAAAIWAVAAWCALVPTFRFRKLIARHRDLYITHHASSRTLRSLKGRSAHERHERLVGAMQRAARRAWKRSAVAIVAILAACSIGSWLTLTRLRPDRIQDSVVTFEQAWAAADLTTLEQLFDPRVRTVEHARLVGKIGAHGWRDDLPSLVGGELAVGSGAASIDYGLNGATDDDLLRVHWLQVGRTWSVEAVELAVPPFAPVLASFVEAWTSSDPVALASFFAPDARAEMQASIESAVQGRGWTEFPSLPEPEVSLPAADRAEATFRVGRGELETEWHYRIEGAWRLHALRMPRRLKQR